MGAGTKEINMRGILVVGLLLLAGCLQLPTELETADNRCSLEAGSAAAGCTAAGQKPARPHGPR
jgi:hypothetical protein